MPVAVRYRCFVLIAIFPCRTKVGSSDGSLVRHSLAAKLPLPLRPIALGLDLGISLDFGSVYGLWSVSEENKKSRWAWPLGLATGVAGAALVLFRGCWHGKMSWPVRAQGYAYQVCLGCGIKRLFDEKNFQAYGPYRYDLNRLIAWDHAQREKAEPAFPPSEERPAS
jgi:hypothetical protein